MRRSTSRPSTGSRARFGNLDIVFVESGGDNLAATFSPELSDLTIYVIDVAAGDKIPRKGGPGITRSDLLVINKIDLAPMVGASLEVMDRDARKMRGERPFVFTNLKTGQGLDVVVRFVVEHGMVGARGDRAALIPRRARASSNSVRSMCAAPFWAVRFSGRSAAIDAIRPNNLSWKQCDYLDSPGMAWIVRCSNQGPPRRSPADASRCCHRQTSIRGNPCNAERY